MDIKLFENLDVIPAAIDKMLLVVADIGAPLSCS